MSTDDPFKSVRRGLLELAVLTTLSPGRLYAAEILERLAPTPFATQEGTLSLDRCEVLYSGLTESGTAMLQSQTPTCGEIERYFIRGALSGLAYP